MQVDGFVCDGARHPFHNPGRAGALRGGGGGAGERGVPTPYTLNPAPYTLHPEPQTLNPKP